MSIPEKLTQIAENQQKVYDAGKAKEQNEFWEALQDGGNRSHYMYAFRGRYWTDDMYHPKYTIKGDMQQVFASSGITDTKVPIVVDGGINYGFQATGVKVVRSLDLTDCTSCTRMFYSASNIESITFTGLIKFTGLDVSYCPKLDKASLLSLLNCLEEKTDGGVWEVALGSANKAKLTDQELAIAQNKGWTVK